MLLYRAEEVIASFKEYKTDKVKENPNPRKSEYSFSNSRGCTYEYVLTVSPAQYAQNSSRFIQCLARFRRGFLTTSSLMIGATTTGCALSMENENPAGSGSGPPPVSSKTFQPAAPKALVP